ncbi:hypothetical protein NIES4101_50410 [Calothrix sp. NIES-4101]|nr:hypothetical protein NIES4101_50410 [Calothrix sp. NIES-4101]
MRKILKFKNTHFAIVLVYILFFQLASSTALAGGSLPLSDLIEPVINQSDKLKKEVNHALSVTGKKPEQIICIGVRLGKQYAALSAARVAPFSCQFAENKYLTIKAINFVKLPHSQVVTLEQFLKIKPTPENVSLTFKLKSWKWQKKLQ